MLLLDKINVYRGPVHVLRDVSLDVKKGEIVGLLGRNGAGKSTTLKSIVGILPIASGSLKLDGHDVTGTPAYKAARLGIGFAPEDARVFQDLTAEENLKITIWLSSNARSESAQKVEGRIFSIFPELKALMKRRGLYLSGGEKKMLSIARALALSPKLLLLDESFEGLAPVVVNRFAEAIRAIREMGVSILLAESNLLTASRVVERLYAIDRGEIIFAGKPEDAFQDAELMKTLRGY